MFILEMLRVDKHVLHEELTVLLEELRADKHEDVVDQLEAHGHEEEWSKGENESLQQAWLLLL